VLIDAEGAAKLADFSIAKVDRRYDPVPSRRSARIPSHRPTKMTVAQAQDVTAGATRRFVCTASRTSRSRTSATSIELSRTPTFRRRSANSSLGAWSRKREPGLPMPASCSRSSSGSGSRVSRLPSGANASTSRSATSAVNASWPRQGCRAGGKWSAYSQLTSGRGLHSKPS
jgi:hypothetical protein